MAGLDWICASPAQFIEPGERAGVFRIGGDELLTDADGGSRVNPSPVTRRASSADSGNPAAHRQEITLAC